MVRGPVVQAREVHLHEPLTSDGYSPRNDLPRDLSDFTGRGDELAGVLAAGSPRGTSTALVVLDGMAGVGKTALAVRAAHLLSGAYPDGQLFIDLHGHTPGQHPLDARHALEALLRALGVPPKHLPRGLDERAALWRARLTGRRVLVVLDNAVDERQVRYLLPGAPGCLVLITSRRRLVGLDDAQVVSLDVMPREDAAALLQEVSGRPGVLAEEASGSVLELCGNLPLAIRLIAARLRHRPGWTVADLHRRLADTRRRLVELRSGDTGVAAAFDMSYHQLTTDQQRAFRHLALHPGPDLTVHAVAANWGVPQTEAERLLDELYDVHLLEQRSCGRYWLHDLLRDYAQTQVEQDDHTSTQTEVTHRVLDYYLHTVHRATVTLSPWRRSLVPSVKWTPPSLPEVGTVAEAEHWIEVEWRNLLATVDHAAEGGWHDHAWQIPRALFIVFYTNRYLDDWLVTHLRGLGAARAQGNRFGEGEMLNLLGGYYTCMGQYRRTLSVLERAAEIKREIGDQSGLVTVLGNTIMAYERLANYADALVAFKMVTEVGEYQAGGGRSLIDRNVSLVYLRLGNYDLALQHANRALILCRAQGGQLTYEAKALAAQGAIYLELERHDDALASLRQAIMVARQLKDKAREAESTARVGVVHAHLNDYPRALSHLHHALELNQQVMDEPSGGEVRNLIGSVYLRAGYYADALHLLEEALDIAQRAGTRYQEAFALHQIGSVLNATHGRESALPYWERALALYTAMQVPEAQHVRGLLNPPLHRGTS